MGSQNQEVCYCKTLGYISRLAVSSQTAFLFFKIKTALSSRFSFLGFAAERVFVTKILNLR